ncbi:Na(+)/H(+) antiporter NhaA [Candidatus Fokinia solitaria]|uniref:Putative Na(+)/H(+) antiporter NhaA homolog n=1 Tax=Candidatus Fokinia solitaria TaxID=1802984 RepID=A0A2U8BRS5_9RICK|nr:Na+/H+ antiporter NhaA [Candidatus Fokinia solitaria]AWD33041.1 Na(+)/H(+) antiporter NhaA [Candidatus Fokinia solitaria]
MKLKALIEERNCLVLLLAVCGFVIANLCHDLYERIVNDMHIGHASGHFLMPVYFMLIGIEMRKEMAVGGILSSRLRMVFPLVMAISGVLLPAVIYATAAFFININVINGWAIPTATDIAFATTISLVLQGLRKNSRKILTAIAIFDDLIAVLVVAIFYSSTIEVGYLPYIIILACFASVLSKYMSNFTVLWLLLFGVPLFWLTWKSGIHSTVCGFLIGVLMPFDKKAHSIERFLQLSVTYVILPLFALCNTGITVSVGEHYDVLCITFIALILGKNIGISASGLLMLKRYDIGYAISRSDIVMIGAFCGIGFTMGLFIATLSFDDISIQDSAKAGVILGSIASAAVCTIISKLKKKH